MSKPIRLYKTNSFQHSQNKNNPINKTKSASNESLNESVEIKPLGRTTTTSYLYDGLGGRQKIVKSENLKSYFNPATAATTSKKPPKLTKYKVT